MTKTLGPILATALASLTLAAAQPNPHTSAIDVKQSKMTVYVFKEGLFAFAADNHEVDAPIVAGSFDDAAKSIQIWVDASKMQVLDPQMAADRRAKVQSNMAGPDVLDVAKYPKIIFQSTAIDVKDPADWTVSGNLTLHGQMHPLSFHITRKDATHFSGAALVRQTDFGITPIRIAGGMVRVKNDVKVIFDIVLQAR